MEIPTHRRRMVMLAALDTYATMVKKAKKAEADAHLPVDKSDEMLVLIEILKADFVDKAAVDRDSLLAGTPMGDALAEQVFLDTDGATILTADALDDWLRRSAHCFAPFGHIVKWRVTERQTLAAWLRAMDSNTFSVMEKDTTLSHDMAVSVNFAKDTAPTFVDRAWFRDPIPLDALTEEGITAALETIGCLVPPGALADTDAQTRASIYRYVQDVTAGWLALRPPVVDVAWFNATVRESIEKGEALAVEERMAVTEREHQPLAAPLGAEEESDDDDEDDVMDEAVLEGWLIAGPWGVANAVYDSTPSDDWELVWTRDVPEGEERPQHPFVYAMDVAREKAAKLNQEYSREHAAPDAPPASGDAPTSDDPSEPVAESADDSAGASADDEPSAPARGRKKKPLLHKPIPKGK
jgi:hypothetical protein